MSDRPSPPSPAPVVRWQPPRAHQRRRARRWLVLTALGVGLIGFAAGLDFVVRPAPRLVWNPSASAPVGLWRIHPDAPIHIGDMVLVETPAAVRRLAATRRYLPMNVPLLKRVVAADGDRVCALGSWIVVNGVFIAPRREADRQGRPLPWWRGCRTLRDGQALVLMEAPESFDGRYFGPVERASIIGRATPLWLP